MKANYDTKFTTPVEILDIIRTGSSRGLDFVTLEELRKRTGIDRGSVVKFALSEMLCNALDKDSTKIGINVSTEGDFNVISLSDNGSKKLFKEDLNSILDFDNKASSKRGILRVSRGYLGNALKCIFGFSHALTEAKKLPIQSIIVESGISRFEIKLKPNLVTETIDKEIKIKKRVDNGLTLFSVRFPEEVLDSKDLEDIIIASCMVNPSREISYNILGKSGLYGYAENSSIRQETSVLWYKEEQFEKLFKEYVKASPKRPIKDFIAIFRGFTGKPIIWEILQEIAVSSNHDVEKEKLQFFPTTPLKDIPINVVQKLYVAMKAKSKPIEKRSIPLVLGVVGKETFEKIGKEHCWSLRYLLSAATKLESDTSYPYLVEFAIFDRSNDGEGLKVYQCVNFMASMEDIFTKFYDINHHLGLCSIKKDTPVTVIAHLVCPVLKWLNYGKSGLDE